MATFKYVAKDQNSRSVSGKIIAENEAAVIAELRKRKLAIIDVAPAKGTSITEVSFSSKRVKGEDLVIFTRQMATMIDAGIPILQALDALQEQMTHPYFKTVISNIRDDIQLGSSLSAAFSKHPKVFDSLFINMVKVGETGGVLSDILDRIALYMEKSLKLRAKVKSALIYPTVIVIMAIAITAVLLVKVVPTFAGIYKSFNRELPPMTQALIQVSAGLKQYILGYIIGIFSLGFLLKVWHKTEKGGLILDTAKLKIPIFGPLLRKVAISRFSRTLATLAQSGVPILESLEIVGKSSGNHLIEKVVEGVKNNVREGESISIPLVKSGVFPPMVTRMIDVGEKSGQLEKMLTKIAEFYDDQVDTAVAGLTSIIEPVIIGFLGIVVGFIVIALFLPILSITQIL